MELSLIVKILFLSAFFFAFNGALAQATITVKKQSFNATIDSLIQEIEQLQITDDTFYNSGLFPSQRGKHKRKDNTIFFSALISYTLQGISEHVTLISKQRIDSICAAVHKNYPAYSNRSNGLTYNFWKREPALFFPNSKFLSSHPRFQIPDDADCTAMIYLTDPGLTPVRQLQDLLAEHANRSKLRIKNTFRRYRSFRAYSTWFGKKMPIEFDICVQSNVLLLLCKNQQSFTVQDSATILLLKKQIESGDYLRYSAYLSPSYKKKSIVLYHLSRLLENNKITSLENCKLILKKDIQNELKKKNTYMDHILLSSALIRMDGDPTAFLQNNNSKMDLDHFAFFRANLFSSYARPCFRFISKIPIFDCNYYCKAYNLALLAEYESLLLGKSFKRQGF